MIVKALFYHHSYLDEKWKVCIASANPLPHPCISLYNDEGNFIRTIKSDDLWKVREEDPTQAVTVNNKVHHITDDDDNQTLLEAVMDRLSQDLREEPSDNYLSVDELFTSFTEIKLPDYPIMSTDNELDDSIVFVTPNHDRKRKTDKAEEETPVVSKKKSSSQSKTSAPALVTVNNLSLSEISNKPSENDSTVNTSLGKNLLKVL